MSATFSGKDPVSAIQKINNNAVLDVGMVSVHFILLLMLNLPEIDLGEVRKGISDDYGLNTRNEAPFSKA